MNALCGILPPDIPCFFKAAVEWLYNNTISKLLEKLQEVIIQLIAKACDALLRLIADIWTSIKTPQVGLLPAVTDFQHGLRPVQVTITVFAIVVAGIRMGWTRRGDSLQELFKALVTLIIVTAVAVSVVDALTTAGDYYSGWVLKGALGSGSLGDSMTNLVRFDGGAGGGTAMAFTLVVIIGVTCILVALIQIALMYVRAAGLILVTVMLPVSVAATNTEMGQRWFRRTAAYLIMFILYKPAAATVYAAAITMVQNQPKGTGASTAIVNAISGVTLMVLSVFLMPALMRLIIPAASR